MATVYVSVGSNIERDKYIQAGIDALKKHFGSLICSPVYESESVGFSGDNFYNLVVSFETGESYQSVDVILSNIEDANQRDRSLPKFSSRTLDLDLLLYDDLVLNTPELTLPRPEVYKNAFVLQPLADIAASVIDPNSKQTFAQLWAQFDRNQQKLWQVELKI